MHINGKGFEGVDWIQPAQDRDQCQVPLNKAADLRASCKVRYFAGHLSVLQASQEGPCLTWLVRVLGCGVHIFDRRLQKQSVTFLSSKSIPWFGCFLYTGLASLYQGLPDCEHNLTA
jgi:hypothetical protein